MVAVGTYTNCFTAAVSVTVGLGWRLATQILVRQSPLRLVLSVAAALVKEGFKVKVETWINKQKRRKGSKIFRGVKLTFKRTIRWVKQKREIGSQSDDVCDSVALDAGMKYRKLAKRRLDAARTAFEAAALELKESERGMKDADIYVKSLRSHYKNMENTIDDFNDIVFVEHAEEEEHLSKAIDSVDDNALVPSDQRKHQSKACVPPTCVQP